MSPATRAITVSSPGQAPVAAYAFDEGTGTTLLDQTGKGHTGTVAGPAWTAQGRFGSALTFDGVNDWVTVNDANDLDFTTGMTMEAWVVPDGVLVVAHRRHEGAGRGARVQPVCRLRHERADGVCRACGDQPVARGARRRGCPAQRVDSSRRDLRWDHAAPLRQRQPGRKPGRREPAADFDGRASVRRQQRVGRILRGAHRRSPSLQPGARRCRNPGRHGRANRNGHDTSSPFERSTDRSTCCGHDPDHVGPDHERERDVQVRHDRGRSPMRRCRARLRQRAAPLTRRP